MHKLTETDRMAGWTDDDDLTHYYTLLKQCFNCGWWTQFDKDPDSESVFSEPKGERLRCMNCGGISFDYHSTISHRTFDFAKKGGKVKLWDPSNCPPLRLGNSTQ